MPSKRCFHQSNDEYLDRIITIPEEYKSTVQYSRKMQREFIEIFFLKVLHRYLSSGCSSFISLGRYHLKYCFAYVAFF